MESDAPDASLQYRRLRRRLVFLFERWGCNSSGDLADETLFRVVRRLRGGLEIEQADNPFGFVHGVARLVFAEWLRHRRRVPEPLGPDTPEPGTELRPSEETADCVRRCLRQIGPEGMKLLRAYYGDDRSSLAGRLDISPNALRIRVFREKGRFKECLDQCLMRKGRL
jgi:DNA-directed RNA polymerase specialized sigma24 family protein